MQGKCMMKKKLSFSLLVAVPLTILLGACSDNMANNDKEIIFWHSMGGKAADTLNELVNNFNKSNPGIKVKAINKGSYDEALNLGIAAYRANKAPDIMQVYEVGTATMLNSEGVVKPVYEVLSENNSSVQSSDFVPAVAGYYANKEGKLMSLPFNSSTPILYYNKDAFKKAGLNPDNPPKTFEAVKTVAEQLVKNKASGLSCGITTGWPAWILLENGAARNNTLYASEDNGFGGLDARLNLRKPYFKKILTDLSELSKDHAFVYGGRGDKPGELFTTGQCGMLIDSSGNYAQISEISRFELGVAQLPYYASLSKVPKNSIIGGASLWVFNGKSPEKYRNIAKFLTYLSSPKIGAKWHQSTGYVPVTKAAYKLTQEQGFYTSHPDASVPIQQLLNNAAAGKHQGVRLGNLPAIRDIELSEMEKVFSGKESVDEALAIMEAKGNQKLKEFQDMHTASDK